MNHLEPIITYNLNEIEAKAFKLTLLWKVLKSREFPDSRDVRRAKNPKEKDPRTTILFKYCLKLAIETKGIIPDDEYKLYITAQLQTLRDCANGLPVITPACLVGAKAWRRWKIWKVKFESCEVKLAGKSTDAITPADKIKEYLIATKKFLDKNKINDENNLKKAVLGGDVSIFYLILSKDPCIKDGKVFGIDIGIYEASINEEIKNYWSALYEKA